MKVEELIKELETFDKKLDVKCAFRSADVYEIVETDVGEYIEGTKTKPYCKILISNWDVKR